jgi:N-methylhydantoinase B
MFRGGTGCTLCYIVHDTERIPTKIMHTSGSEWPESAGISGGGPSQTNQFIIKRKTDVRKRMANGEMPERLEDLSGDWDIQKVISVSYLDHDDVFQVRTQSGGGYGDPLDRDPSRVLEDVRSGVVSREAAKSTYGVAIDPKKDAVSADETERARREIRERRRKSSRPVEKTLGASAKKNATQEGSAGVAVNEFMHITGQGGSAVIQCSCGQVLSDAARNFKEGTLMEEGLVKEAGPHVNEFDVARRFVYRQFYCPGCLRRLETEVCLKDEPILHDVEVAVP